MEALRICMLQSNMTLISQILRLRYLALNIAIRRSKSSLVVMQGDGSLPNSRSILLGSLEQCRALQLIGLKRKADVFCLCRLAKFGNS